MSKGFAKKLCVLSLCRLPFVRRRCPWGARGRGPKSPFPGQVKEAPARVPVTQVKAQLCWAREFVTGAVGSIQSGDTWAGLEHFKGT